MSKSGILLVCLLLPFTACTVDDDITNPDNQVENLTPTIIGPQESEIVNADSIFFEWNSAIEGVFSYKLDNLTWSQWTNENFITLHYLGEGNHSFSVKMKTASEDYGNPTTVNFFIDAIDGPVLLFNPKSIIVELESTFKVELVIDEIEGLKGCDLFLDFDHEILDFLSIEAGDFFSQNSGEPAFFDSTFIENSETIIHISSAELGGENLGVAGTGILGILTFRPKVSEINTLVKYNSEQSEFRDPNNQGVNISNFINMSITIK